MNRIRATQLLHALGELIGLPGALKIVGEIRNDFLTEASDIVLVGNDEDVHTEDQTFLERAGLFLVIRQVVDVAQRHRITVQNSCWFCWLVDHFCSIS
jgi:hypothetical protein